MHTLSAAATAAIGTTSVQGRIPMTGGGSGGLGFSAKAALYTVEVYIGYDDGVAEHVVLLVLHEGDILALERDVRPQVHGWLMLNLAPDQQTEQLQRALQRVGYQLTESDHPRQRPDRAHQGSAGRAHEQECRRR